MGSPKQKTTLPPFQLNRNLYQYQKLHVILIISITLSSSCLTKVLTAPTTTTTNVPSFRVDEELARNVEADSSSVVKENINLLYSPSSVLIEVTTNDDIDIPSSTVTASTIAPNISHSLTSRTTTRKNVVKQQNEIKNKFVSKQIIEMTSNDDNMEKNNDNKRKLMLNKTDISIVETAEKIYDELLNKMSPIGNVNDNTNENNGTTEQTMSSVTTATAVNSDVSEEYLGNPTTKRPRKTMKLKRPKTLPLTTPTPAIEATVIVQTTEKVPMNTQLPTDEYFISGLSDLLLENHAFDRIDDILTDESSTAKPIRLSSSTTILSSTATTIESKTFTSDTFTKESVIGGDNQDYLSTSANSISFVSSTLNSLETTATPSPITTTSPIPKTYAFDGTIATEKTINGESLENFEPIQHSTNNNNKEDEHFFTKLKNEEDEKLNLKGKTSNQTKKKSLKPLAGGGGGLGKPQNKKSKLNKKLAVIDESMGKSIT
jgi:hypothetical protein